MKLRPTPRFRLRIKLFPLITPACYLTLFISVLTLSASDFQPKNSQPLQALLDSAITQTLSEFSPEKLKPDELASTLILFRGEKLFSAHFRGSERIYPASVIKLFYLEAAHRWMEDGKLADSPELRRAMSDMIVLSYNEATGFVVDSITGTTSGPELPPAELEAWENKRNAINRYFKSRGFLNINANQKPWCEGPYGRERQFVGEKYTNRNALTTDATARLLAEIAQGEVVSNKRSEEMLELLRRDPFGESNDPDDQAHGFTGPALPPGAKLWSKAGWTSNTRHDAALIELPDGTRFVLVTFTVNHANQRKIIPTVAHHVIEGISAIEK